MPILHLQTHVVFIGEKQEKKTITLRMEHNPLRGVPGFATGEMGAVEGEEEKAVWQGSGRYFLIRPNPLSRIVKVATVKTSIKAIT
jgi:hypothetical protein